jgi:two-component system LytT family response regulator
MKNIKRIRAIIVDDEKRCIANLQHYLSGYPLIEVIATANTATEALKIINENEIDVAFFDVEIFDENVFDIIQRIGKLNFEVVFVTAYDQYAVKAFKVEALDYLLKPLSQEEVTQCYNKIYKKLCGLEVATSADVPSNPANRKLILKQGGQIYVVLQDDVYYMKAKGFYTQVFFTHKNKLLSAVVSKPISDIEVEYSNVLFYRVHKSYMVNVKKIKAINKAEAITLKLMNDDCIPVAKRRLNNFLAFLNNDVAL